MTHLFIYLFVFIYLLKKIKTSAARMVRERVGRPDTQRGDLRYKDMKKLFKYFL